jgi:hypothetical protein
MKRLTLASALIAFMSPIASAQTFVGPLQVQNALKELIPNAATARANLGLSPLASATLPQLSALLAPYLSAPSLVNIPDTSIYQRDTRTGGTYGKGVGAVTIGVNVLYPISTLEDQINEADTGAVVLPYASLDTNVSPGTHSYVVQVPSGLHRYTVTFRPNGLTPAAVTSPQRFMVGEVIATTGQSLADRFLHQFTDKTTISSLAIPSVAPYCSIYANWSDPDFNGPTPTTWTNFVDGAISTPTYNSAFLTEMCKDGVQSFGVPVAIIGYSHGGTASNTWVPGTANFIALTNNLTAAGGKFGTLLLMQGHSDASAAVTAAAWQANWQAALSSLQLTYSGYPFKTIVSTIPDVVAPAWGTQSNIQAIRGAGIALAATAKWGS